MAAKLAMKRRRNANQRPSVPVEREKSLPDYASQLFAFHEEFAPELKAMLAVLPLQPGDRVLDVACGDGIYSAWLSSLLGPQGNVTAIDASRHWLTMARRTLAREKTHRVTLKEADALKLPFQDMTFDFVWCAQSFYSLPDVGRCLAEMIRVLRPGGTLAILEDDSLHHVLLPWPIELELEVRAAELAAFRAETTRPARYYIGRWLSRLLRRAGLRAVRERAFAATRQAPLAPAASRYFGDYLHSLAHRVRPHLSKATYKRFERLVNPTSRSYLLRQPGFVAVCLDRVVWGKRPATL
jgi:ubiquinone/menaquinone biosynthesis C-methylase UbiE